MFDLWQKMVNPGAYPLQSLMFPVLDPKELEKKIGELEVVEHWLKANVNMVQLTIRTLQFQRAMVKGGKAAADVLKNPPGKEEIPDAQNPASWPWTFMAQPAREPKPSPQSAQRTPGKKKKTE
jgi:hypothetical protein